MSVTRPAGLRAMVHIYYTHNNHAFASNLIYKHCVNMRERAGGQSLICNTLIFLYLLLSWRTPAGSRSPAHERRTRRARRARTWSRRRRGAPALPPRYSGCRPSCTCEEGMGVMSLQALHFFRHSARGDIRVRLSKQLSSQRLLNARPKGRLPTQEQKVSGLGA